jgi:Leucine-rich repeat (LRR) protein
MKQLVFAALFFTVFLVLPTAAQTNVALNKAVTVSTVQSGNIASNAVDGNTTTRWCASSGSAPQWLMVDLGSSYSISRTETMWEKTAVYKYRIETSPDNSTWTQRVDRTANTLSQQTFVDNFTVTARYVRITATSLPSGVWASIFEFRVFGISAPTPPVITTQPVNRTVTEGQSATFTIAATGNPTPTYLWRRNGTNISGATLTSYTIATTAMTDSGAVFSCVVSNSAGNVTSNNAVLTVQSNLRRQDSLALVALYNSTGGPNWTNKDNWLTMQPIDTWYNVRMLSGRVESIWLEGNNLVGTLPHEIGYLTALQTLALWNNSISGPIPDEIMYLTNLTQLCLENNSFTGALPLGIWNARNLQILRLYRNQFTGAIPGAIGNLSNLMIVLLDTNKFTDLSDSVTKLTRLEYFHLNCNQFCNIPPSLAAWAEAFDPGWAATQTCTPPERRQDSLALVALFNSTGGPNWTNKTNWLTVQPIDTWYGISVRNNRVGTIKFQQNHLVGPLPPMISALTALDTLRIRMDSLSGSLPPELWTLTNIRVLDLEYNLLSGAIPSQIGNLINLIQLDLSTNGFTGTLPRELGILTNLERLDLMQMPKITGTIPPEIGNLTNLKILQLQKDSLIGSIPTSLGNLINLTYLGLWSNKLSGIIPSELGNLINLEAFYVQYNNFTGSLPSQIGNWSKLTSLAVEANSLNNLPIEITNLHNLSYVNIGYNRFCNLSPSIAVWANTHDTDWASTQSCVKPEVQITASPLSGVPPLAVSFTATNIGSTMIDTWNWTFGDGGFANTQNSSHVYSTAGAFTARLIAKGIGNSGYDTASVTIQVNTPPAITTQPLSQTVNQGATASFTVIATGTTPLSYQWYKNRTIISGATSATYSKTNVQQEDTGSYTVTVSNVAGSATSNSARLTVTLLPVISTQPVSQTVNQGSPVTFSVVASGTAPLLYQWRKNGTNISGASALTFAIASVQQTDSGNYTVVVSNNAGSVTSAVARLTVSQIPQPPVITSDLESRIVSVGGNVIFSVTATGTQPLSYEWRKNGVVVGGNASTFAISPVSFDDSGSYKVIVTNALGSDTSADAILTVVPSTIRSTSQQVSIRGRLYDISGAPVGGSVTDTIETTVRLYDSLNGGAVKYTEFFRKADEHAINVNRGVFTIVLGQGTTTDTLWSVLARDSSLWVEITIDGSLPDVLLPRLPLTAAPYMLGNSTNTAALRTARIVKDGFNAP